MQLVVISCTNSNDELMSLAQKIQFRYKSMESINEKRVIDIYRLIDTIDINQIRFSTEFYRLINRYRVLAIDFVGIIGQLT